MPDNDPIISHSQIWNAIDTLAARSNLSPSGLARLAGLDPTAFNKSKRSTSEGRERWPSTESIAKVLRATSTGLDVFTNLMTGAPSQGETQLRSVPVVGVANEGEIKFYDKLGSSGLTLDVIEVPADIGANAYGIAVGDTTMEPVYRCVDLLIVDQASVACTGDRVVVKPQTGSAVTRTLLEPIDSLLRLGPIAKRKRELQIAPDHVLWMDRIIWVSQ